ncbi:Zinc finger protein 500 [Oryzias melastigma]|uniref:Zinc finger protein 500 n=1 Tax=Oryzias melastigma TaxID=30732 RepID=A0A834F7R2_ORYME|nr:Zinc finger protein 500 [Oryzias melastigma]
MATCIPFQTQLSSIMEVLVKAAVAEISKLVDDKCAFLHLELSRKQSENEMLRRKLLMMEESRNAQPPRGRESYSDRGSDARSSCPHPGDMKFHQVEDAAASFPIKEESPDEALWISDPAGPAVQFCNAGLKNQKISEGLRENSEFSDSYNPAARAVDANGLQFTIKTEKEEGRLMLRQDGCQHGGAAKPAADFTVDERENQLWSSIIEGADIDAGFPDFSSVVEEYSSAFSEQSDGASVVSNSGKPPGVQQASCQRPCNGIYRSEFHVPQLSDFPARTQQDKPKEQVYVQTNSSHAAPLHQLSEDSGRVTLPADRPAVTQNSFTTSSFYTHKAHSGVARGYTCSQCGKSFSRLHQFKLHQQSHKRKRAFWCAVCGKSFQCSSHLSIHHRTHTGEKPYGCGQCGKRFTQQSSLRVHQRTHSGERPYSCAQCGKTFILMHHLKRHRIIHTYS